MKLSEMLSAFDTQLKLYKSRIYQALQEAGISPTSKSLKTVPQDIKRLKSDAQFDIMALNVSQDGAIIYKGSPTGYYFNVSRDRRLSINNQVGLYIPKEFDRNLMYVDERSGELIYSGLRSDRYVRFNGNSDEPFSVGDSKSIVQSDNFDASKLSIRSGDGYLTYKDKDIGKYVNINGYSNSPYSLSTSAGYSVPKAFNKSLITLDSDGELRYDGSRLTRYVNVNGTSLSLGSSSSLNWPPSWDPKKLTKIDSNDGQLYYDGGWVQGKYVNVNGKTLSLGSSKSLNWPEAFDKDKLTKIDSNDGQLYYEGVGWLAGKYVNINGNSMSLGSSSSINWPSSGGGYVSDHHRFNVAWGGDGLYYQSRNLGKRTVTFDVSAFGYGGGDLNFDVTYD